jgi:hypothetical protein
MESGVPMSPLFDRLAKRLAETSCWDDLTEEEQDELTMAWLEDEGRLDNLDDAIPIEDIPEMNESASNDDG